MSFPRDRSPSEHGRAAAFVVNTSYDITSPLPSEPWINMDRPGIISVGWIMYLCVRLPVVERLRTRVHTAIDACHHSGWLTGRFRLKNQSVVWNINFRRQVLICQQVSLNICIRWTIWISTNATWVFFTKNYTIWFCSNIFFLILFDKVIMKIFNDVGYRLKLRGFFC